MSYYYTSNFNESSSYYYNHHYHQPFFSNPTPDSYNTSQFNSYDQPPPTSPYPVSYDHDRNYACYNYNQTQQPVISYSAYHPHYLSYNSIVQDPASTQFVISYSNAAESTYDIEFEEYDPTPYGGGYDMNLAYGKPLPASDKSCYPRSTLDLNAPKADDVSVNGIVAPYGDGVRKEEKHGEREEAAGNGNKKEAVAAIVQEQRGEKDDFTSDDDETEEEVQEEEVSESSKIGEPATLQDCGFDDRARNGNGGYGEKMRQIAPGYGLEAKDICECLFGYWPCLAKRNQIGDASGDGNCYRDATATGYGYDIDGNYWKGTADYLFGNPNPYGGAVDDKGNYGNPLYCYAYQRGFQQDHLYQQLHHQYQQVEYGDAVCDDGYGSGYYCNQ